MKAPTLKAGKATITTRQAREALSRSVVPDHEHNEVMEVCRAVERAEIERLLWEGAEIARLNRERYEHLRRLTPREWSMVIR